MNATAEKTEKTRRHEYLANDLRANADAADKLADDVRAWGDCPSPSAREALGLIRRADEIANRATRLVHHDLIGRNTRASHGNNASIALGISWTNPTLRESGVAYKLMYALGEVEQYGPREDRIQSLTAVAASSLRVYASSARVVAPIADEVAAGEYGRIG